jgi:hypothetical protein
MRRSLSIALIIFGSLQVCSFAADSVWKVEGIRLAPASELSRHFSASVLKKGSEPTTLEADVPLTTVKHWFISGDKLVVPGRAGHRDQQL